jgi:vitamin B12 transporter
MSKHIFSYTTALFCSAFLLLQVSYAYNFENKEVVVTASRLPQSQVSKVSNVEIVTSKEIEAHNATNVLDVLKLLPGIQFTSYGGKGQTSSVFGRGGKADQLLFLLDGNPINSAGIANVNTNNIPVNIIERVEYIRGSKASLYGANAITGVVNIITKPSFKNKQSLSYKYSSNVTHSIDSKNVISEGDFLLKVSGGVENSDGYNVHVVNGLNDGDKHEYTKKNIEIMTSKMFDNNIELSASYNYIFNKGNYDNSFWIHEEDENLDEKNIFSVGSSYIGDVNTFDFGAMYTNSNVYDYAEGNSKLSNNSSRFKVDSINWHWIHQIQTGLEFLKIGYGFDFDNNILKSESSSYGIPFGNKNKSIVNRGGLLFATTESDNLDLELNVRFDDNSVYGSETSYSLGSVLKYSEYLLSLKYATSFRAPTLQELYYPGYGNENLKVEESKNYEVSFTSNYDSFTYSLIGYYIDYKNLISSMAPTYQYYNVSEASSKGVELVTKYRYDETLNLRASIEYMEAMDGELDRMLQGRARFNFKSSAFGTIDKLEYNISYNFMTKRYNSVTDYNDTLGSFGLLNIGLKYKINNHIKLGGSVENLFDKKYEMIKGYSTPGVVCSAHIELFDFY